MTRSILALAALLAFTVGASVAFACPMHVNESKQTLASVDGKSSKPITTPKSDKDS
jgi:hypothetical protein